MTRAPRQDPDRRNILAGKVVVLLEDDELIRRATERILRRFGAEVVAGRGSAEVVEILADRGLRPDCVVADYWLSSRENGLSAVAAVREAAESRPRGVIVTGDLSSGVTEAVTAAGFDLLRKPVDIDDFIKALSSSN